MLSSRSKKGKKIAERGNPVLSHEAVKLLKTQDSGYLRTMIQKTRRAIEKLEQEFILREGQEGAEVLAKSGDQEEGDHVVFVDSREEQKQYTPGRSVSSPSRQTKTRKEIATQQAQEVSMEEIGDVTSSLSQRTPKSRRAVQREADASKQDSLLRKWHKKEQEARRAKLVALKTREKDLNNAENELELQRAKMSNNIGGVTRAGVKWRPRERKK